MDSSVVRLAFASNIKALAPLGMSHYIASDFGKTPYSRVRRHAPLMIKGTGPGMSRRRGNALAAVFLVCAYARMIHSLSPKGER